jgi:alpha-N-arabinofuranosidase
LVGHWPFDDDYGTTSAELTGSGKAMTLTGSPTFGPGRLGNGLVLSGTGQSAQTASAVLTTNKSYTVSAWVKWSAAATGDRVAVSQDGTNVSAFRLRKSADGTFAFELTASDAAAAALTRVSSTSASTPDTWYHLAGVVDTAAGQMRRYVNGVLQGGAALPTLWSANGPTVVGAGKTAGQQADLWQGTLDDVRVFSRALPDADVQKVAGVAPVTPPAPVNVHVVSFGGNDA